MRYLIILILLIFTSSAWGTTYYVDPNITDVHAASATPDYTTYNPATFATTGGSASVFKTMADLNTKTFSAGDIIYLRAGGVWAETLYAQTGSAGNPITYDSFGTGNKPSIRDFSASGATKSYITLQNLEFKNNVSGYVPISIANGANHIRVLNCSLIAGASANAYAVVLMNGAAAAVNYNEISNCDIQHLNTTSQHDGINLRNNAHYNLIKNNTITGATHYNIAIEGALDNVSYAADYNVIKGNTVNVLGSGISVAQNSSYTTVEDNIISGGSDTGYNAGIPVSLKIGSQNNIVRRNVIKNNPAAAGIGLDMKIYTGNSYPNISAYNKVYNNIITGITNYPFAMFTTSGSGQSAHDNYIVNNIFYNNAFASQIWTQSSAQIYDNYFFSNIINKPGTTNYLKIASVDTNLANLQAPGGSDQTHFIGNITTAPLLDSSLHPLATSATIDGGITLAKVTSATGSGTSFVVDDAGWFSAGFTITTGDTIKVGATTATITGINYGTKTITVGSSITWVTDDPVSLPYQGTKPDIGPFEFASVSNPPPYADPPVFKVDPTGTMHEIDYVRKSSPKMTVPTYADNTAALAGGLTAGKVYRTSTGILMIVY